MSHFKLTGYILMMCLIILLVTGTVLTYQSLFGIRINRLWDKVHTVSTFAMIAFIVPHIILIILRNFKANHAVSKKIIRKSISYYMKGALGIGILPFAVIAIWIYAYEEPDLINDFPEDYSYLYGEDRPFAPSLATTSTGGALEARALGESESCGTDRTATKKY